MEKKKEEKEKKYKSYKSNVFYYLKYQKTHKISTRLWKKYENDKMSSHMNCKFNPFYHKLFLHIFTIQFSLNFVPCRRNNVEDENELYQKVSSNISNARTSQLRSIFNQFRTNGIKMFRVILELLNI